MRRSFTNAGSRGRTLSDFILPAVFLVVGSCFLLLSIGQLASTVALITRSRSVTASYIGSVVHAGGGHGGMFSYPRFRFRTPEGTYQTVTSTAGSSNESYSNGETVRVFFDPQQPGGAVVDSFWTLWIGPLVCGVLGCAFALPGLLILLAVRRRRSAAFAD